MWRNVCMIWHTDNICWICIKLKLVSIHYHGYRKKHGGIKSWIKLINFLNAQHWLYTIYNFVEMIQYLHLNSEHWLYNSANCSFTNLVVVLVVWKYSSYLQDLFGFKVLSDALEIFAVLTKPLGLGNASGPPPVRKANVERQNLLTKAEWLALGLWRSHQALERKQLCMPRAGI